MKRIQRLPLSPKTVRFLAERSRRVAAIADPRKEARRLWKLQVNQAFREIRKTLGKMASGLKRCMYCEVAKALPSSTFGPRLPTQSGLSTGSTTYSPAHDATATSNEISSLST